MNLRFPTSLVAALPFLATVAQAQYGQSTYIVPQGMVQGGQFIHRFPPMKPNGPTVFGYAALPDEPGLWEFRIH